MILKVIACCKKTLNTIQDYKNRNSKISTSYKYNKVLKKNNQNRLNKDSIVKCDDLISISEVDIIFKIGEVSKSELKQFIDTYKRYLNSMP